MFGTIFIAVTETQKFAYIAVVFGSIAFKLMTWVNLDVLQPASHSSLQEFGPIPPDRSGVAEPSLYAAWFLQAFPALPTGLRSAFCDGHFKTLTLLSWSYFVTMLVVCLGSLVNWKTVLHPGFYFLADALRCCFSISNIIFYNLYIIYFIFIIYS